MNITFQTSIDQCNEALSNCQSKTWDSMISSRYEIVLLIVGVLVGLRIMFYWRLEERLKNGKITKERFDEWREGIDHYEKFLLIPIYFVVLVVLGLF